VGGTPHTPPKSNTNIGNPIPSFSYYKKNIMKRKRNNTVFIDEARTMKYGDDYTTLKHLFRDLRKASVLSVDDEVRTAMRVKNGDVASLEKIISSNMRFVVFIAKRYSGFNIPIADLIAEGSLGLIYAIRYYDVSYSFKFISYAVWWIRKFIEEYILRHYFLYKMSMRQVRMIRKIEYIREVLYGKLGREPSLKELSEECGISIPLLKFLLKNAYRETIFIEDENLLSRGEGGRAAPLPSTEKELDKLMRCLTPLERKVAVYLYGLNGMPQIPSNCIPQLMNISYTQLHTIKKRILAKLRKKITGNGKLQ